MSRHWRRSTLPVELDGGAISAERFGWKAHYLSRLAELGYRTPGGYALAAAEDFNDETFLGLGLNGSLAVRSSGLAEDSAEQSLAGSYASIVGVSGAHQVTEAVKTVRDSGEPDTMGVIVQPLIDAEISGAAFSLDPTSYATDIIAISWVRGQGSALMSGAESGEDLVVDRNDGSIKSGHWDAAASVLQEIRTAIMALAGALQGPVDIEWCLDRGSGNLVFLQVRPIVLPSAVTLDLASISTYAMLPAVVRRHPKLRLRQQALELGVRMTPAVVSVANTRNVPDVPVVDRSSTGSGSSVVLVYPTTVEKKVVREFANVGKFDVHFFADECRRYSIRQYPSDDGLVETQLRILARGLEKSSVSVVIEQEIWDAYATGIVRQMEDGYLIEAGLGHFIPKGYVQTSSYFLDKNLQLTSKHEVDQLIAYQFIDGHVLTDDTPTRGPQLSAAECRSIIVALNPLLNADPSLALEFGLKEHADSAIVYLIDAAESDQQDISISRSAFEKGVISHGTARGSIRDLRGTAGADDLNAHLLQEIEGEAMAEPTIYIAHRATVDLLSVLYACAPGSGFVFEQASLLAHLAVVLRERGVAAVVLPPERMRHLAESSWGSIDTAAADPVRIDSREVSS